MPSAPRRQCVGSMLERREDAAGEIVERIAIGFAADDLAEDLEGRRAVGEALAGRGFGVLRDRRRRMWAGARSGRR